MSNHCMDIDVMYCISEQDIRGKDPELGTFVLDTDNPNRTISISTGGTFKLRTKNMFFCVFILVIPSVIKALFNPCLGKITMQDIEKRLN